MCKAYRVYFSTPPTASPTDDYLVDHSFVLPSPPTFLVSDTDLPFLFLWLGRIYFYLLDPNGAFVDAFGKDHSAENVIEKFDEALVEWKDHERLAAKFA